MTNYFLSLDVADSNLGSIQSIYQNSRQLSLGYPCPSSTSKCTPYILNLSPGIYRFECWGAKGTQQQTTAKPGLGGYTAGTIHLAKTTTFYIYIGSTGFFNSIQNFFVTNYNTFPGGGATDVRLNLTDNWWDQKGLISRIMVSAGGGGVEWFHSIGGNGGGLKGGSSHPTKSTYSTEFYDPCDGATQNSGSQCLKCEDFDAVPGTFGSAGVPDAIIFSNGALDYGGFGGGGYYGGTSYEYSYAGSGGSSYISGHKGCNSVAEDPNQIQHTDDSVHYSTLVFTNTLMIDGNTTMPLPFSPKTWNIWSDKHGAFRITILSSMPTCRQLAILPSYSLFFINSIL